jgi:hypothetical protein
VRSANHRKGGTEAPAQLRSVDLPPDFRLPVFTELVTEPEGIHECQVQTPDRSALQLFLHRFVGPPPFLPQGGASTDVLGETRDGGDREQLVSLVDGEKWVDPVVEVGEEEDCARRERVHEVWLIHAV